jgi:putative PIN family toxin of toxin-antitoxin system
VAALMAGSFEAAVCPTLLEELGRALRKPYFGARLSEQQVRSALEALATLAMAFEDPADPPRVLRDPADDYLLALAAAGGVEAIVTGDKDLLEHPGLEPPAITAREAIERHGL